MFLSICCFLEGKKNNIHSFKKEAGGRGTTFKEANLIKDKLDARLKHLLQIKMCHGCTCICVGKIATLEHTELPLTLNRVTRTSLWPVACYLSAVHHKPLPRVGTKASPDLLTTGQVAQGESDCYELTESWCGAAKQRDVCTKHPHDCSALICCCAATTFHEWEMRETQWEITARHQTEILVNQVESWVVHSELAWGNLSFVIW